MPSVRPSGEPPSSAEVVVLSGAMVSAGFVRCHPSAPAFAAAQAVSGYRFVFPRVPRSTFLKPDSGLVATPHTDIGTPLPLPPAPPNANAAASLRTTASEYARLVSAVLNGTGLKTATAKLMLTPQVWLDPACINCTDRPAAKPGAEVAWGLGWGLEQTSDGPAIWHWGDNPGFKAYVTANVAARRGVVYFTNSDSGLSIRDRLVDVVLGGTHPALAQVVSRQLASAPQ